MAKRIMTVNPENLGMRIGEVYGGDSDGRKVLCFVIPVYGEEDIHWSMTKEVALAVQTAVEVYLKGNDDA